VGFLSSFSLFPPVEIQSKTLTNKPATSRQKLIALRLQVLHTHHLVSQTCPTLPQVGRPWPMGLGKRRVWKTDIVGTFIGIIKKTSFASLSDTDDADSC
jgi:hypothetical protein